MIPSEVNSSRKADLTGYSSIVRVLAQAPLASRYTMFSDGRLGPAPLPATNTNDPAGSSQLQGDLE